MSTQRDPDGVDTALDTALAVHPLTPDRWEDLVRLFGPSGAEYGCWDMYWRLANSEFVKNTSRCNRAAFQGLVDAGAVTGLLAYRDGEPVGWCSLGPRESYGRLERSRVLRPVDDTPVWSIVCFFVHRKHRHQRVATTLLRAAVRYAAEQGAQAVEGYPVEPRAPRLRDGAAYPGTTAMFRRVGFREVAVAPARGSGSPRAIMRFDLG